MAKPSICSAEYRRKSVCLELAECALRTEETRSRMCHARGCKHIPYTCSKADGEVNVPIKAEDCARQRRRKIADSIQPLFRSLISGY